MKTKFFKNQSRLITTNFNNKYYKKNKQSKTLTNYIKKDWEYI